MDVQAVTLEWEEGCNIVVGQAHFIKTVEDIAEIMNCAVPGVEYGLAFCESSGPCLIRRVGAGHSFYLVMRKAFPINVLNQIKGCQEVARIFCATANPLQVLFVQTGQGRGIVGVVDGVSPKGVESQQDRQERRELLRTFRYKF